MLWNEFLRAAARRLTARSWAKRLAAGGTRTFMFEPVARRRINRRVTGDPQLWPMDYFAGLWPGRRFERALSLGSGEGALERDIRGRDLCASILGIELSADLVALATRKAAESGLEGIEYRQGDLNSLELPERAFDIVFVHQALHHVEGLEFCLDQVRRALIPGGIFYVDEYVGPSRGDWDEPLLESLCAIYRSLPPQVRRVRRVKAPVDKLDPSEAIRSAEILPLIEERFSILERRDYGGQVLAVLYPNLGLDSLPAAAGETLLEDLLDTEDRLQREGVPSYYSWLLAQPLPSAP